MLNNNQHELGVMLHRLGVSSKYQGFDLLQKALMIMLENCEYRNKSIKYLYNEVSRLNKCSSSSVERNIRTCIEKSWDKVSYETIDDIFGSTLKYEEDRPSNREFIYNLFDFLKFIDKK